MKIFGSKMDSVSQQFRTLYNEDLCNSYTSSSADGIVKVCD